MSDLSFWRGFCLVCLFCTLEAIPSPGQIFKSLLSFNGLDGAHPEWEPLVQGLDGNLYGTTSDGGADDDGTVFKVTQTGTLTLLHSFHGKDGSEPFAGLVQATNGTFYGTTLHGGTTPTSHGTVFEITPAGTLTVLHSFCSRAACEDGAEPETGLAQGTDGNFYGTTSAGGAYGDGTVFKITPSGTLTTLYAFDELSFPNGLVAATDGNFYGTTGQGGAYGGGTVFKITPTGTLTTLYSFTLTSSDGDEPFDTLVQAPDGNFYGTTLYGGTYFDGTVFKITPSGTLTTLHSFDSAVDGSQPGMLVLATDGNFYGTTWLYTVFRITLGGTLTTLHRFQGADGSNPFGLVQATNGIFYGATSSGGADDDGTVYALALGLGPFVETLPTAGKVGEQVKILGNNLTGSTRVTFNGTPASFTVVSSSEIDTTVPGGATTGKVRVTTPSGTLTSNVDFQVMP